MTAGLKVLLADDHVDSARTLCTLLELWGHSVEIANDGRAAVSLAAKFTSQVGVLDISLPGLSGYDVARQIRALPHGGSVTLIALTGHADNESRQRALLAGFNHFLVKPVDPLVLRDLLASLTDGNS
jgi:CheY-like chemotaxis protein